MRKMTNNKNNNKSATNKRRVTGSSRGGGFGTSGSTTSTTTTASGSGSKVQQDGDYSVFAKLEPHVLETLIPSTTTALIADSAGGELPLEIYHRLDQIYGFPDFNYPTSLSTSSISSSTGSNTATNAEPTMSLTEMLTANEENDESESETATTTSSKDSLASHLDLLPPFSKFHVLHVDPLVLSIDDFFTPEECDLYIAKSSLQNNNKENNNNNKENNVLVRQARSPTVGKDAVAKAQRTSTTWYHAYANVPELLAKACRLLGLNTLQRWEEPQTVRYRRNEKFTWHLDALGPQERTNQPHLGGQRVVTLLVYLTELQTGEGGATIFRDLVNVEMRPRKGAALLFFPAAGGIPQAPFDIRTLHCGEAVASHAAQDKWIGQLWLRHTPYQPSTTTMATTSSSSSSSSSSFDTKKNSSNSNSDPSLFTTQQPDSRDDKDRTAAVQAIANYCQSKKFQ